MRLLMTTLSTMSNTTLFDTRGHVAFHSLLFFGLLNLHLRYSYSELHAVRSGQFKLIIEALLKKGFTIVDNERKSVMLQAGKCGNADIVRLLASNGGDVNMKGQYGRTPLHEAALQGNADAAMGLLDAGADMDRADVFGHSFVDMVTATGSPLSMMVRDPSFPIYMRENLTVGERGREQLQKLIEIVSDKSHPARNKRLSRRQREERENADSLLREDGRGTSAEKVGKSRGVGCTVDRVDTLSFSDFFRNYVAMNRPVIVSKPFQDWPYLTNNMTLGFLRSVEDMMVNVSDIPYPRKYGGRKEQEMSVRDYLATLEETDDHPPPYIFISFRPSRENYQKQPLMRLFDGVFAAPTFVGSTTSLVPQFALGKKGSGAPIHHHISAWNVVLMGEKRWFLNPPHYSLLSSEHISTFTSSDDFHEAMKWRQECVQYAGEVMWVPTGWGHGVLNTKHTMAFATQLENSLTEDALSRLVSHAEFSVLRRSDVQKFRFK